MFAEGDFSIENISLGSEDNAWNKDPFENIEQYYGGIDFESYRVSREIISYVPTSDEKPSRWNRSDSDASPAGFDESQYDRIIGVGGKKKKSKKKKKGGKDKILGNKKTKSSINTNKKGSTKSLIDTQTDTDWFKISLKAGYKYKFDVKGGKGKKLKDSYLRIINGKTHKVVASDDNSGKGKHASLSFTAKKSGKYFLEIKGGKKAKSTGSYIIKSKNLGPSNSAPKFLKNEYDGGEIHDDWDSIAFSYERNTGKLTAKDRNKKDKLTFTANKTKGKYGTLSLNKKTGKYKYTGNQAKINALGNVEVEDTFKVFVSDGKLTDSALLKFEIMGSDDKPTISKPTQGYAAEITDSDEYYGKNLSGKIAASDPEGSTLTFENWSDPSYGDFSIDWNTGVWVYTPRINGLGNEVVYDKLTVEVSDGLHS